MDIISKGGGRDGECREDEGGGRNKGKEGRKLGKVGKVERQVKKKGGYWKQRKRNGRGVKREFMERGGGVGNGTSGTLEKRKPMGSRKERWKKEREGEGMEGKWVRK